MSIRHPIVAITGSSGAGTSSVTQTFQHIFRREQIKAALIEGDAFHRYERMPMQQAIREAASDGNHHFSHFGPDANLFDDLESLFRTYAETGTGTTRQYQHDTGTFTPWVDLDASSDLLFYEGLHGGVVTDRVNVARHVDLLIGVVPIINLEWIQKIHRDNATRGYSREAIVDTILRRMPDFVHYVCPQFSRTHVNFQRVPTVDTSNPFIARDIPTADESFLVIRFRNPKGIDFPYLITMLHGSFMSRPNSLVVPGGKMPLAMQIIFTPMILQLIDRKRRAA